eukprot:jgi/Mesen1/9885/ME000070S09175
MKIAPKCRDVKEEIRDHTMEPVNQEKASAPLPRLQKNKLRNEVVKEQKELCQVGTDICELPVSLLSLPDFRPILCLDTWENVLSEADRKQLLQYLPDVKADALGKALESLFSGEDICFGSPMERLSEMFKAGECSPSVACYAEGLALLQKRQHYHNIRQYHNRMVSALVEMKRLWQDSPETDLKEKLERWQQHKVGKVFAAPGPQPALLKHAQLPTRALKAADDFDRGSPSARPTSLDVGAPAIRQSGLKRGALSASTGVPANGHSKLVKRKRDEPMAGSINAKFGRAASSQEAAPSKSSPQVSRDGGDSSLQKTSSAFDQRASPKVEADSKPHGRPGGVKAGPKVPAAAAQASKPPLANETPGYSVLHLLSAVRTAMLRNWEGPAGGAGSTPTFFPKQEIVDMVVALPGDARVLKAEDSMDDLVHLALRVLQTKAPPGTRMWKPFVQPRQQCREWAWCGVPPVPSEDLSVVNVEAEAWGVAEKALAKLQERFLEMSSLLPGRGANPAVAAAPYLKAAPLAAGPGRGGGGGFAGAAAAGDGAPVREEQGSLKRERDKAAAAAAVSRLPSPAEPAASEPDSEDTDIVRGSDDDANGGGGGLRGGHSPRGTGGVPLEAESELQEGGDSPDASGHGAPAAAAAASHGAAGFALAGGGGASVKLEREELQRAGGAPAAASPRDGPKLSAAQLLQRSQLTLPQLPGDAKLQFQREERLRYGRPDVAFRYTAVDGGRSTVAPIRRMSSKATAKARDHAMLKASRPAHVTVLCLVRDAAARLPRGVGTRADVCALLRDSQFFVAATPDAQLNQIVSGAMDRLHYERDACIKYDAERKAWHYLHRERSPADFDLEGLRSTRNDHKRGGGPGGAPAAKPPSPSRSPSASPSAPASPPAAGADSGGDSDGGGGKLKKRASPQTDAHDAGYDTRDAVARIAAHDAHADDAYADAHPDAMDADADADVTEEVEGSRAEGSGADGSEDGFAAFHGASRGVHSQEAVVASGAPVGAGARFSGSASAGFGAGAGAEQALQRARGMINFLEDGAAASTQLHSSGMALHGQVGPAAGAAALRAHAYGGGYADGVEEDNEAWARGNMRGWERRL